ncbi:MAG: malate/lactate/ureidoglycolate dehydrogenase [Geminicoccaceae bacterium]
MNLQAEKLEILVATIFERAESSPEEARTIARHLVGANLVGHDSHGVIRVSRYVGYWRAGTLRANQQATIAFETDSLALVDGHRGYGQVIGEQAVRIGIDKARRCGIALVGLRDVGHVGRVGDWAEMAAEAGQVSLHFVGTTGIGVMMVPFGGTDRRLSLCVVAAGIPRGARPPIIYDVATSMVAEGKVFVAKNKGVPMPEGHLIDKDGKPTTDPNDLYAGGALLPFGGHKGSGLAIITDLLAGALTGAGCSQRREQEMVNTMCGIYVDPDRLPDRAAFDAEVDAFVEWVKASPPADPDGAVLLPGDLERRMRAERLKRGIPLDETTLAEITEAAVSVGLAKEYMARSLAAAQIGAA